MAENTCTIHTLSYTHSLLHTQHTTHTHNTHKGQVSDSVVETTSSERLRISSRMEATALLLSRPLVKGTMQKLHMFSQPRIIDLKICIEWHHLPSIQGNTHSLPPLIPSHAHFQTFIREHLTAVFIPTFYMHITTLT